MYDKFFSRCDGDGLKENFKKMLCGSSEIAAN